MSEQEKWTLEKKEQENLVCTLREEVMALKAQSAELQTTIDAVTSGQPNVDSKVSGEG